MCLKLDGLNSFLTSSAQRMSARLLAFTCCGVLDSLPETGCDLIPGTGPGLGAEGREDSRPCSLNTHSLVGLQGRDAELVTKGQKTHALLEWRVLARDPPQKASWRGW